VNREEVLEMAEKAGIGRKKSTYGASNFDLQKFARLIAENEREKVNEEFERRIVRQRNNFGKVLLKAVADEREACAKVCEQMSWPGRSDEALWKGDASDECAKAIRARGEK
jgi:ribosomal protein L15